MQWGIILYNNVCCSSYNIILQLELEQDMLYLYPGIIMQCFYELNIALQFDQKLYLCVPFIIDFVYLVGSIKG